MRYDLDDMYGMLGKYREKDEEQAIQRQEKASQEKNAVLESHLTEKTVPANNMSDQQENTLIEQIRRLVIFRRWYFCQRCKSHLHQRFR